MQAACATSEGSAIPLDEINCIQRDAERFAYRWNAGKDTEADSTDEEDEADGQKSGTLQDGFGGGNTSVGGASQDP